LTNSNHSAKTLHIEKTYSLSIFKTLWENITHWEIKSFCKNITHWEIQITLQKHYTLRNQNTLRKHYTLRKSIYILKITYLFLVIILDNLVKFLNYQNYFLFLFWFFSFGTFFRKRNQHILLSAIKSTEISTDGRYPPIPDIHTSAEILVYSFRRINFTTFSDIIHTNHLSIYFHFALLFFQCVDKLFEKLKTLWENITHWETQIILQKQNTFDFQNTLRKHYTLRKNIHFRFSKHFEKTLHIEKKYSLSIFKTLWENITHWEIKSFWKNITHWEIKSFWKNTTHWEKGFTFDFQNTLRKHYTLRNQIILEKYYTLRNSKHFGKTQHIEKKDSYIEN